jgi:hypothetical protein
MTINWHNHEGGPAAAAAGRARPLTEGEQLAAWTVAVMVAALGVLGFVNSFRAVARAAVPSFGALAPTVPLGIDLAIAVFSAMDLVLARLDMRPRWVRLVPWSLTAATIYLNVAGQHTWFGRIAHAVFPALWVLAVSLAAHVIRVRAQLAAGAGMDRIRPSRWLLAPVPTVLLWRRMVLWEIRSYPGALDRERRRLLALTDLQDAYGVIAWRWNAPRRVRALYRLGEMAPAGLIRDEPRTDPQPVPLSTAGMPVPAPAARTGNPARTSNPARTDGGGAPLAGEPRAVVVEMIAGQIRDAVEAGEVWRPDYEELMQLTDRRRSWCEKVVRDARNLVLTPPGSDHDDAASARGEARQDTESADGADDGRYADADRTGDLALAAAP